jgi:putative lipoprotein
MPSVLRLQSRFLATLLLSGLVACGRESGQAPAGREPGESSVARIEGSVWYRERMALPPGAEVEVQLQDVSRVDAMATVLASVHLTPETGPPYPFTIEYDPGSIDPRMRYALRATISFEGRLMFTSTEYIDPFAGHPVEVLVRRTPSPAQTRGPALEGTRWVLETLGGEAAATGAGGKPVDLELLSGEKRAAGFSGCNRYTGGYSREGASEHASPLSFGNLAGTMMACVEGGEVEQLYLRMLGRVNGFRLQGDTLSLLDGPEVLATFRAQ